MLYTQIKCYYFLTLWPLTMLYLLEGQFNSEMDIKFSLKLSMHFFLQKFVQFRFSHLNDDHVLQNKTKTKTKTKQKNKTKNKTNKQTKTKQNKTKRPPTPPLPPPPPPLTSTTTTTRKQTNQQQQNTLCGMHCQ